MKLKRVEPKIPPENCKLAHCCKCCEFVECPANWSFEIENGEGGF